MPRPVRYPWDHSDKVGLNDLPLDELRAHVDVLRARRAELERVDVRGMRPADERRVRRETRDELEALRFALQSAAAVLTSREQLA